MRFIFLFILLPFFAVSQNCNICPAGTSVQLTSTHPALAVHQWTCSNGFTSNLQNPTFSPTADCSCNLVVTQNGCTSTSTTTVNVCECDCNGPCVAMNYSSTTDCVTFNNTGSNCSPVTSDVIQWKNQNTAFATIANGAQVCDCNIKEYVNTAANVTVVSTNFRLNVDGLNNRCAPCTSGTAMRIDFQFPISGSTTSFPGCAATNDWLTISPSDFTNNGNVCDAYVRYNTPFGTVINQYRYQYNGGGLNAANVTVTQIAKRTIYKDITAKRTVTYSDGCPSETCEITLDIPQQPNDPCTHVVAYVQTVNIGTPCSGSGYAATVINGLAPITYQWTFNGTNVAGNVSGSPELYCLVGQPFGTYCVQITDAAGCVVNACRIYQACTLITSITAAGNILTATNTGCVGTATYQWQRWNGTTFVNVGTNTNTYNTAGLAGDYRVNVTCSGPPVCNSIANYTFTPPCTYDVTVSATTTVLTATATGCTGTRSWVWDRWNGTAWINVQTTSNTNTTNTYTPTLSGLYRITSLCAATGCSDQAQISFTLPNPCAGFSSVITGTFTGLCVGTAYVFNSTQTGGTAPFTKVWKLNGTTVGTGLTYTYTPTAAGTNTITLTVTDNLGCTFTDIKNVVSQVCCGLSVAISPTSVTKCVNESQTFTATPTGGTAPITYVWTSTLAGGSPINQGTGNTKTLTFSVVGVYTIVVTGTDNQGCQFSATATMTVSTCTNCTCTPALVLTGCVLNGSFTGAGCGGFNYQLQYSVTGTGWSTVASGSAAPGGTITHTPTANGFYRLVIFGTNCNTQESAIINVTCYVATCSNSPTLTFTSTSGNACGTLPITINGSFGGSATSATFSENGLGTLSPVSVSSSPFTLTYTPLAGDIGGTVTVSGTTNNPLGAPCTAASSNFAITVNALPTVNITSSNATICVGTNRTLIGSPTGGTFTVTGPATVSGNVLTATGAGTINVTYTYSNGICSNTATQTITSMLCPCQGITMTITTLPGRLSFGTLNYNGIPMTNYRIEWRKCSDNSVVFQSGMGTGAGAGIYSHPTSNLPLIEGCYYAQIITSDQGSGLDCFADINIVDWSCSTPPSYTYSGPGGAAATREFQMDITPTTTYIRIGSFNSQTTQQTNPDLLELIYNGVTIYNSTTPIGANNPAFVPITYIVSDPDVLFRITNINSGSNTSWGIDQVSCCNTVGPCPTISDVPSYISVTSGLTGCLCNVTLNEIGGGTTLCQNCQFNYSPTFSFGGCNIASVIAQTACEDGVVVVSGGSGTKTIDYALSGPYNAAKTWLLGFTNPNHFATFTFKNVACASDGALQSIVFYPNHSVIVYDDVNFIITVTPNANPFTNNCNGCNNTNFLNYGGVITLFNSTSTNGSYLSVLTRTKRTYNLNVTQQNNPKSITLSCQMPTCQTLLERQYNFYLRDVNCPCQSWQLLYDADNNGSYETIVQQAAGWTGTCL